MTRMKLAAISTLTAAMILGSTLVFAAAPAGQGSDTGADATTIQTELPAQPARRGGGGGGGNFKN